MEQNKTVFCGNYQKNYVAGGVKIELQNVCETPYYLSRHSDLPLKFLPFLCFVCLFPWASAASHGCTTACWLIVPPALDVPTLATRCPALTDAFRTLAAEVVTLGGE
jgi:hypothetical protein